MDFIINIIPSPMLSPINRKTPRLSPVLTEIVLTEKEHSIIDLSGYLIEDDYFNQKEKSERKSILSFLQETNKKVSNDEENFEIDMLEFDEVISTFTLKELKELNELIDEIDSILNN